ncbi:TonB-dependent siderophore receptor [Brucella oryzae]|nr:TonB-dependent siderophore receptor [Brucella oryzae]
MQQRDGAFVEYVTARRRGIRKRSTGLCAKLASLLVVSTSIGAGASGLAFSQEQSANSATNPTVLSTITINADNDSPTGPDNSIVAKRTRTASKTNTSLLETPQAVSIVTRQQMNDQGADTVPQALRYTPGVLSEANGYDIRYDWIHIRGYNTYGTIWMDNLALPGDPSSYATPSVNPYALERIEVIKGPASVLYGRTMPGGLVNYVSKRPQATPHNEVVLGTSAFGGIQTSVDSTGPVTKDGDWQYRFVGQWRNMHTQIDQERDRALMFAPSLTWSPSTDTSLTVSGYYQRDRAIFNPRFYPAVGTLLPNSHGQIPRDLYLGDPEANEFNRDFYTLGYEFSHDFNETWSVRQNLRYSRSSQDMFLVLVNPAFAYQPDGHTLNRASGASDDTLTSFSVDTQAEARFDTGGFDHTVLFGLEYLRATSDRNFGNATAGVPPIDYLNPVYGGVPIPYPAYTSSALQKQHQVGVYMQDQIRYDHWVGTLGLRYDRSEISTFNRRAIPDKAFVENSEGQVSGRAGLTYLFDNGFAPYVSYSTTFTPLLGVDAFDEPYKAQRAGQFEVGVKYEPLGTNAMIAVSLFNLDIKNALTPYLTTGIQTGYVQSGRQRVRGVEVEGKFELTREIELLGSYAYSDSEVLESNLAVERGREILRLPEHQASIWVKYSPMWVPGLSVSAGVRGWSSYQTDSKYLDKLRIPGQTLVDLGAEFDFGQVKKDLDGMTLRVNATNLFDRKYVSHCLNDTGGSCNYGAGRAINASLKYSW